MRRLFGTFLIVGLVAIATQANAETAIIKVRDDYFTPHFRVLVTGDQARFIVEGSNGHTVTSYPGSLTRFDSSPGTTDSCTTGDLLPEETDCLRSDSPPFDVTFDRAGTFDYFCKIHGNSSKRPKAAASAAGQPCRMCGQIVVKTPSSSTPASRRPVPTVTESREASPSPSVSPSASVDPSDDPSTDPSLVAGPADDGLSRSSGRAVISIAAILLLSGLGYLVWRRFLGHA